MNIVICHCEAFCIGRSNLVPKFEIVSTRDMLHKIRNTKY